MKIKIIFITMILALTELYIYAQSAGDFRTKQSGNWNQTVTWQRFNGSLWVNATTTPTYSDGVITVQNGHTVTVTADVQIDQTIVYGIIIINASQELRIRDGSGTDFQVYGTITNYGTLRQHTSDWPTLAYYSGAKYTHAVNGDRVEYASWNSNATCEITGVTDDNPSYMDQSFGHVIWNCTGQTSDFTLLNDLLQIQGNFSILSTNNKYLELSNTSTRTMNIGGNFLIDSTAKFILSDGSADNTMNVNGSFTIRNGSSFYMSTGGGYTTLNIKGDFIMTGGFLQQNSSYNRATINFNGTTAQTYTKTGGTMYYGISFIVKSVASVDFGTSVLGNHLYTTGTFTLESGATLKTAHTDGITASGANGCIQVQGLRSYHANANYHFYCNGAQSTGNGLQTGLNGVLTVGSTSNATSLNLTNGSATINNKLVLTSSASANSSIASGTVAYGSNSILEYQGASAQTTANAEFPSISGPYHLTINNPNGVVLHASRNIAGTLFLQSGNLTIGSNTLTLNGAITKTGGNWTGGNTSNLLMGGSGASTNLPAIELNNLTINRSNGTGLAGTITVNGTTTMTTGTLTSNGYFIVYGADGSLQYNGSSPQTTGEAELPGLNGPKNLSVLNPAGVSLHASRTIEGILTLGIGAFSIGSNTLTINGEINRLSGSLTGGIASNIVFGENATPTILSSVTLNDLTINRSSGITMAGGVTIGGSLHLTNGIFAIEGNLLTVNGSLNIIDGSLQGGNSSSLTIGGSGPEIEIGEITLATLSIIRPQGALLLGDLTIKNVLQLMSGSLQIGSNTIFMDGDFLMGAGNLIGGMNSNILIRPSLMVFLPVNLPGVELGVLSVNRLGGVTMNGNLFVHQNLLLELGNFSIGSNTLTLIGELNENGGVLLSNENSVLMIGGNGLPVIISLDKLQQLHLNRPAGIALNNNLAIYGSLTLASGEISLNGQALSYQPGATLRYAGFTAQLTSDNEFPSDNGPTILEIMNPSGVELHESRTVDGSLSIFAGNFLIAENTLTLNGELNIGIIGMNGGLVGGIYSNLVVGGLANTLNLNSITLNNFTINRPMGVALTGDLDIFGVLYLEDGLLPIMNNKLIIRNPIQGNPDNLMMMFESSLEISGLSGNMNIGPEENIRINQVRNLSITNTNPDGIRLNGNLDVFSNLIIEPTSLFIVGENKNLTVHGMDNGK